MKPVAPALSAEETTLDQTSLQTEILRHCEAQEPHQRVTIPAPPSPESLRMATPVPPAEEEPRSERRDTTPAPPPSSIRRRTDTDPAVEEAPATIPGPPRVPSIAI
jgi:hypothetical protein